MTDRAEQTNLTNGTGAPLAGWDADESAERIRVRAHARPEHAVWLKVTDDKGQLVNHCERCDV